MPMLRIAFVAAGVLAAGLVAGCGNPNSSTIQVTSQGIVVGNATVNASVHSSLVQASTAPPPPGGCVIWSFANCSGQLCGFLPGSTVQVTCYDPVLAEIPSDWTVLVATWSAPALSMSGNIVVEPISAYAIPPAYAPLVLDPGYSAYVLHLDQPNVALTDIQLHMEIDRGATLNACVKATLVTTADAMPVGSGPRMIVPTDTAGFDFTRFQAGDPHVFCIDAVGVAATAWGRLKTLFR
jgi:hypothetical protein